MLVENDWAIKDDLMYTRMRADIVSYQKSGDLKIDDIRIVVCPINYAFKDKNPVDFVKFYNNRSLDSKWREKIII